MWMTPRTWSRRRRIVAKAEWTQARFEAMQRLRVQYPA
jgi:hypothetical protein